MVLHIDSTQPEQLPSSDQILRVDGVVFEDAAYLISDHQPPYLEQLTELAHVCIARFIPTLGVGFGARLIAHAEGGEIQLTPSKVENGEIEIYRLRFADDDPLFSQLPETFKALCQKQDDILTLPISCLPLANSERTQFQAFKIAGQPIYGVQFDTAAQNIVETFTQRICYPQR